MKKLESASNPNIINCVKNFEKKEEQNYIIVIEYCNDESLKDLIQKYKTKNKKISESEVLKFMRQMLLGINTIHKNNIIHGDLNPSNILINSKGDIKLPGFELTRDLSEFSVNSTMGTTFYSSPEILKGDKRTFQCNILLVQTFGH